MDSNVWNDIVKTLYRLETQIESQGFRLETIEDSIHSSLSSQYQAGSSIQSPPISPVFDKPLPNFPESLSQSTSLQKPSASLYKASIVGLQRNFEFKDDDDDEGDASFEPKSGNERMSFPFSDEAGGEGSTSADKYNTDVYSLSVYTPQLLSRFDLGAPPVPQVPITTEYENLDETNSSSSRASTNESWSSDNTSSSASTQKSHERAELAYYAYDNFFISLQSSRSLRSQERKASRAEVKRLQSLAPPAETASELAPLLRDVTSRVRRLLMGLFHRSRGQSSFRVANGFAQQIAYTS
ncbi:hypothetical protein GGR52DRAFT_535898 [Hypoxylon sp. FL1284]|nr:hypothetical protein GGR52DRAFT_535898 [Hypoxylon sp. FL1284]